MTKTKDEILKELLNIMQDGEEREGNRYQAAVELKRLGAYQEEVLSFFEHIATYSESSYKPKALGMLYRMEEDDEQGYESTGKFTFRAPE